jgi:hypothetical protein
MLLRHLALTLAALAFLGAPVLAQEAQAISTQDLMRATALDEIFTQFGPTIEASPAEQGVPFTASMNAAWVDAARDVFDAEGMHDSLVAALEDKFDTDDYAAYDAFFSSDFGHRVSEIERAVTVLPPEAQLEARSIGIELAEGTEPRRREQIEEMLELVSAEIASAMVRQSVRGMLIGMSMTGQQGDIQVPWQEIDAHLELIMPEIEADVALTQRAMMYFAYRELTEAELDTYLEFLRTEPARKFYAIAAFSIGEIITDRMEVFGETIARNLSRVNT